MKTGPESKDGLQLIVKIEKISKKNKSRFWRRVARTLAKPLRLRPVVNVGKLSHVAKPGSVVLVPGKVLGSGELSHRLRVAAKSFSKEAERKIKAAGGECISLLKLAEESPRGSGVVWVE